MSCEQVRESLLEFLGEPKDALPEDLRVHLESCAACREEQAEMQDTWAALGRMEEEPSSDMMRARFHAMLARESAGLLTPSAGSAAKRAQGALLSFWTLRPALQAGMLAATLVVGVLLGTWIGSRQGNSDGIEELRAEMRTMNRAVTLSLLNHQSASERLRAVGLCESAPPDEELIKALLRVVDDDPSANVRLAALEVLASVPARPDVLAGLLESLPRQASPPVTAAMAALLLELDGSDAVEAVRHAARDDRLPDSVRQYLLRMLAESAKATGSGT